MNVQLKPVSSFRKNIKQREITKIISIHSLFVSKEHSVALYWRVGNKVGIFLIGKLNVVDMFGLLTHIYI